MSINYSISKSSLSGAVSYVGRTALKGSYNKNDLVSRMIEMRTSLSKEDIEAVLSLFESAVYAICLEGNKVTLDGFLQFTPTISGTFDGLSGSFDRSRNEIYLTSQISSVLNNRFANDAEVVKVIGSEKAPLLFEVDDNSTGEINKYVTKNNIITIYGEKLKHDAATAEEHLRFVNAANSSQYIEITNCQKNTDKEIVFLMPATEYASGYFEIASKMNTSTVRTGRSSIVIVR